MAMFHVNNFISTPGRLRTEMYTNGVTLLQLADIIVRAVAKCSHISSVKPESTMNQVHQVSQAIGGRNRASLGMRTDVNLQMRTDINLADKKFARTLSLTSTQSQDMSCLS